MCPSYRATREEEHSTRGRSRLLMEMVRGEVIRDGWHSTEVRDALDLCLACKGCRKDCPVEVDMATYKAEFLAHHYKGRLRPASHYSMGWLPVAALLAARAPAWSTRPGGRRRRPADQGGRRSSTSTGNCRASPGSGSPGGTPGRGRVRTQASLAGGRGPRKAGKSHPVADTFTNSFHPEVGKAAVAVLEDAGFTVEVPARPVCCGLTWISTGQLGVASKVLRRTIRTLRPESGGGHARGGAGAELRRGVPVGRRRPARLR